MSNDYYNASGTPGTGAFAASAPIRSEYAAIAAGFAKLPTLSAGTASKAVIINPGGTAMTVTTGTLALAGNFATTGAFATTLVAGADVSLTLPVVSGTLATLAGTETLSNKTLLAPALGTPVSGIATNLTGTASGLTAGTVTTNANLTGGVTSVGNAATVVTNANLTGVITSVGNATAIASQTGSGSKFVVDNGPTLIAPVLGAATATSINGLAITTTTGTLTVSNAKTFAVAKSLTLDGTDGTTMTFPSTSATIARTDAANTFAGVQTFSTPIATGSVATMTATVGGGVPTPPNNTTTFLRGDGTFAAPPSGTVTTVSVTTANGVSGTVATSTTTPAITLTLGAITPTTVNGNTITTGTGTLTLGAGKTLTVSNSLTLAGTDATVMTFPTTSATIARTDAANTFTGTQTFGALVYSTLNGNTWATGTGTLLIAAAKTLTASNTLTLTATDGSTLAIGTGGTLGTAAYKATGTSGNTVALLDGVNTWSGAQTLSAALTYGGVTLSNAVTGTGAMVLGSTPAAWTPADGSGASLAFTGVSAKYTQIGNMVHAYFSLTFPATGDTSSALISGLPVSAPNQTYANAAAMLQNSGGAAIVYGVVVQNGATFSLWSGSGGRYNNAQLSGLTISGCIIYPAA